MTEPRSPRVRALIADDEPLARERLRSLLATEDWIEVVQEVGEGIKVAKIADPFGNIIGLLENPHFQLPAA